MAEEASKLSVDDEESCTRRQRRRSRGASGATIVVKVLLWRGFYYVCVGCMGKGFVCLVGSNEPKNA